MTMYHVLDEHDREVFKTEDEGRAKRCADTAKQRKLNQCSVYHVEKRERVYTTMTLDEAIKGTPFDPNHKAA